MVTASVPVDCNRLASSFSDPGQHLFDLMEAEGLGKVVYRPVPKRLDRGLDRGIPRNENHWDARLTGLDDSQEVQPGRAWHSDIRNDEVVGVTVQEGEGPISAPRCGGHAPLRLENILENAQDKGIVVHNQNPEGFSQRE